jgi:hypothetical protein
VHPPVENHGCLRRTKTMGLLIDTLWLTGWIAFALLLVIGVPALARRLMPPPVPPADAAALPDDGHDYPAATRDLAQGVGLRLATLYGVILALVYAHELGDVQAAREGLAREAVAVADVYHDAARLGGAVGPAVQLAMRTYVEHVVTREWRLLASERRLSNRAWAARDGAYEALLDFAPANPREQALRARMLQRLTDIGEFRHLRMELASGRPGLAFWLPAIAGLALVALPFFVFRPSRTTRTLLCSLGAFAGLLLFFIHAFDSPFSQPLRDRPAAFERLMASDFQGVEPAP